MRDWKTSISAAFTAFFGFVLLHPGYFCQTMQAIAGDAAIVSFVLFGFAAKDYRRSLLNRPWNKEN